MVRTRLIHKALYTWSPLEVVRTPSNGRINANAPSLSRPRSAILNDVAASSSRNRPQVTKTLLVLGESGGSRAPVPAGAAGSGCKREERWK